MTEHEGAFLRQSWKPHGAGHAGQNTKYRPTADRMARGVREVVGSCRTAARRLGLGQAIEVTLEGDFGTLQLRPDESASAAVWCAGEVGRNHEAGLRDILARSGTGPEVDA